MKQTYWQTQSSEQPLFPDLEWSRPETRQHAGKLLIVGGSGYEFRAPANAYGDALDAGIGSAKVLLPDSMQKTVHDLFPEAEFAPSTPSGSFARNALAQLLDLAEWADAVLLAGNLGRNSETAIVLEAFMKKYDRQLTVAEDAIEYCIANAADCLDRPNTTLVMTMAQLQKLAIAAKRTTPITSTMQLVQLVEQLHELSSDHAANLVVQHDDTVVVACSGQVSSTKLGEPSIGAVAAHATVWWLQHSSQPYQALTTAALQL